MQVKIRDDLAELVPYRQGAPATPDAFKLSSNENPFPPIPSVLAALGDGAINRYPDSSGAELRARLAQRFGVGIDEVHIGAGSVSILQQLLLAVAGRGDEVVCAWRSFEAYPPLVTVTGATAVPVALRSDGTHDLARMGAAVTERTRAVLVCSPNNPTGTVVKSHEFAMFLAALPEDVLVILDEAYREFVTDEYAVHGEDHLSDPRVVVLRTFSKAYGLAGLRVGYGIGAASVLDAARITAIPLSLTAASQQAALAVLDHETVIAQQVAELVQLREDLARGLRAQGWIIPRSEGNFVWLPTGTATTDVSEVLERHGIIARAFPGEGIRISIGEPESIERVLAATATLAVR